MKKLYLLISALFCIQLSAQVTLISSTQPSCAGACDGTIIFSATGGSMPYSVNVTSGSGCTTVSSFSMTSSTYTLTGLCGCSSQYVIYVQDALITPIGTIAVSIADPMPLHVNSISVVPPNCFGSCDGEIIATQNGGGALPITITWTTSNPGSIITHTANNHAKDTLKNACAGTFSVVLTDANGCVSTTSTVTLTEPTQLSLQYTNVIQPSCSSCSDGTLCATASGGSPPYTYTCVPSGSTMSCLNNIPQGSYTCCVMDSHGCFTCNSYSLSATTGIQPVTVNNHISIFPNPAVNSVSISSSTEINSIVIFDMLGNEMANQRADIKNKQLIEIDLKNFKAGIYFIKIQTAGKMYTKKFVKE
jgi:hypothetical protein